MISKSISEVSQFGLADININNYFEFATRIYDGEEFSDSTKQTVST